MVWADPLTDARAANRAGDPAAEVAACLKIPEHPACKSRLAEIDARRDPDGGLSALTALEAARRVEDPALRRAAVERVGENTENLVLSAEIRVWLARDDLDRLADPAAAWDRLEAEVPASVLPQARSLRTEAAVRLGRASAEEGRAGGWSRAARLRLGEQVAGALLAGFILLSGGALALGRGGWAPAVALRCVGLVLVGALPALGIAALRDLPITRAAWPLLPMLLGLTGVAVLGLGRLRRQGLRRMFGVYAGIATLAAGWLVLAPLGALDALGLGP